MTDCYFIPSKESSSATICANCGQEKMTHTIGEGLKASKVIINFTQEAPCPQGECMHENGECYPCHWDITFPK